MDDKSKYLYRYTNVDSLEILLKKRTIRFNPLSPMDDNQEQWSAHGNALGNFFFISCWVGDEEEDIRMWQEYCRPNDEGVRIKLPVNPFSKTENNLYMPVPAEWKLMVENRKKIITAIHKCFPETEGDTFDDFEGIMRMHPYKERLNSEFPDVAKPLVEASEEVERHITISDKLSVDGLLHKVKYTDDEKKIYPWIYQEVDLHNMIGNFSYYGKYKSMDWAWQKEWRYILSFSRKRAFRKKVDGRIEWYPIPFDHYDLIVSPESLSQLEVTVSPYISNEAYDRVKSMVAHCSMSKIKI